MPSRETGLSKNIHRREYNGRFMIITSVRKRDYRMPTDTYRMFLYVGEYRNFGDVFSERDNTGSKGTAAHVPTGAPSGEGDCSNSGQIRRWNIPAFPLPNQLAPPL